MEQMGMPFIALHKENLKTPGRVEFFERIYKERRGPFTGRKILVYNQIERDLQIRAGVAEPTRIEIVGMPRLDRMHAWRRANAGTLQRNRILFFVFSPATGMPRVARKTAVPGKIYFEDEESDDGDISLLRLSQGTCHALLRLARDNPDIEVVVKSKGRARDLKETAALFGLARQAEFPPNMRVVHGGDILQLIAQASVVCGFNSTAMLEAVAAGKPVVTPWFAEAQSPEVWPYLIDLRGIAVAASSPDSLAGTLASLAREPKPVPGELNAESSKTLALWTGNDDGGAAARTCEAILNELA
jgi:capsular polysaccharide biosynthesis protein